MELTSQRYPDLSHGELVSFCGEAYGKGKSLHWIARKLGISYYAARSGVQESNTPLRQMKVVTDGTVRVCRSCGVEKALKHFPKDRTKSKGHGYVCTQCRRCK